MQGTFVNYDETTKIRSQSSRGESRIVAGKILPAKPFPGGIARQKTQSHCRKTTVFLRFFLSISEVFESMQQTSNETEAPEGPIYVGVDVGGTNIKIGFVADNGVICHADKIETEAQLGPDNAVERIANELNRICDATGFDQSDIAAVGLGTPGTMDIPKGVILAPPNLPAWRNYPIRDSLSEAVGQPVAYTNDANAAAFGEYWLGSGRQYESIVLLTLGTGVGAGIIMSGNSIDGVNSHGAEAGHSIVDTRDDARICGCGQPGHLEAYASATAVSRRVTERLEAGCESSLRESWDANKSLSALDVCLHAERGDLLCNEIIQSTADYLAVGILNLVHIIDPNIVILGGAMDFGGRQSAVGKAFIERIRSEFRRMTFPVIAENLKIEFATLSGEAGFVGAAGIARQMIKSLESNASTNPLA